MMLGGGLGDAQPRHIPPSQSRRTAAALCAAAILAAAALLMPADAAASGEAAMAAMAVQDSPTDSSSSRTRALAQAPAAGAASSPASAPASGPTAAPNVTQIASGIIGGFNASSTANRSAIAETPAADQNVSTSGVSAIAPTSWALPPDYSAITNARWRITGQDVISKRQEMEEDYRLAIQTVLDPYNVTVRFLNYTTHPSVTPGLEQFACVDETLLMYQYVLPDNATSTLNYGGNNTSGSTFQLTAQTTNLARVTLTGIVSKLGINTDLIQLWGQAIESQRDRLSSGQFFTNETTALQAEVLSRILLEGTGLLPFTTDKQNVFLSSALGIANQQNLPLINLNVSSWEAAPASTGSRKLLGRRNVLQTQDRVYVDIWCLLQPVGNYTPSAVWDGILTTNSVFLPTTLAAGLSMSGSFVNGTSYYYSRNHTLVGSAADPDPSNSPNPFLAAAAPGASQSVDGSGGGGGGGGLSTGAAIGIAFGVAAGLLLLGLLALYLWRRRRRSRGGEHKVVKSADSASKGKGFGNPPVVDGKGSNSSPNDSYGSSDVPSSAASVPGYAEVDPADIEICTRPDGEPWLLGSGAYGQVYKGLRRGVQQVAVKRLTAVKDPMLLSTIRKEISILQRVSFDRNVVQFYGACLRDAESAMLVMELLEGGDVRHALSSPRGEDFAWYGHGRSIALDVARGLHFLHSSGVIHRDLKTSNILLTKEGVAKIADVGLAKTMISDYFSWETAVGTFAYAAPELLMGSKCSLKADCFSFGVILWELVTRRMPIRGQLQEVRVPEQCPVEVEQLIADCITADVGVRPSAAAIVERLLAIPEGRPEDWGTEQDDTTGAA